jgi:hypothetical protein
MAKLKPNEFHAEVGKNGNIDLWGSGAISWVAGIYPEDRTVLRVGLFHTRAADDIEIEYDSERDGWVIYRTVTVGWTDPTPEKGYYDSIEKRKELAFIPAWDDEEVSEPDGKAQA